MSIVIKVENLAKQYRLGEVSTGTLAHDINRWWHRMRGNENPYLKIGDENDRTRKGSSEYVWALREISFEVKQGEVLGIIGRNGAGKSTLLKILSRTTTPTSGEVKIKGRVASLLEVGTGFHPELSGRDNIFLNGAILGMTRKEIKKKFDEIIDFAGVERYIDTPVKRYSSGMYVRLAFAVAAHLEPEILIIDEVLAVGDAEFQKKCLGKMKDVSDKEGRTVIFVSHSMPMIAALCRRGFILRNGLMTFDGTAASAVHNYQNGGKENSAFLDYSNQPKKPGDHLAELLQAWSQDSQGNIKSEFEIGESFIIGMRYSLRAEVPMAPLPNFHFFDQFGQYIFVSSPLENKYFEVASGEYVAECLIPSNFLNVGYFSVGVALTFDHKGIHVSFYEQHALNITITEDMENSVTRSTNNYGGEIPGVIRPLLSWNIKRTS
ncbi:MAG TPA: ABC transporter ATP-binding protein [Puia sp.]